MHVRSIIGLEARETAAHVSIKGPTTTTIDTRLPSQCPVTLVTPNASCMAHASSSSIVEDSETVLVPIIQEWVDPFVTNETFVRLLPSHHQEFVVGLVT